MAKSSQKHLWKKLLGKSPWYFVALFLITGVVAVFALRTNNQNMIRLRSAVFQADKDNTDVTSALHNLQGYVYTHMNTNLASGPNPVYPPIQLKYTYNRLVQAEQQRVDSINAGVYTSAQDYCQQQDSVDFSGRNRVPCIEAYVQANGAKTASIPTALYQFDFISPPWTPDLAGWSLVACAGSFVLMMFVLFSRRIRQHRGSIKLEIAHKKQAK